MNGKMIKEKYKQLHLGLQFGEINTIGFTQTMKIRFLLISLLLLAHVNLIAQSGWNTWIKYPANPVLMHHPAGGINSASDPSIIWDESANEYKMTFSGDGILAGRDYSSIVMATSPDAVNWTILDNGLGGVVLNSNSNAWDAAMETSELVQANGKYYLFYTGYREENGSYSSETALGRAVSTDGINFVKGELPVMTTSSGSFDEMGVWEAGIVAHNDTLFMIYEGWYLDEDTNEFSAIMLKAWSSDYGQTWVKEGFLDPNNLLIGLLHPDIMKNADGNYSLFYSIDCESCSDAATGIYHYSGPHPFGPFSPVGNQPIVCLGDQPFEGNGHEGGFTSTINVNGTAKMIYTGWKDFGLPTMEISLGLIVSNQILSTN